MMLIIENEKFPLCEQKPDMETCAMSPKCMWKPGPRPAKDEGKGKGKDGKGKGKGKDGKGKMSALIDSDSEDQTEDEEQTEDEDEEEGVPPFLANMYNGAKQGLQGMQR